MGRRQGARAIERLLVAAIVVLGLLAGAAQAAAMTWTVTTTADTPLGNGNCQPSSCSLRQAIKASSDGDTVVVPASATPYSVSNGQLVVQQAITIQGAGAASTVIQAAAGNNNRVMLVVGNSAAVKLVSLTITGGNTTTAGQSGGGIAAAGPGPLVLDDVDVVGNTEDSTNAGPGFDQGGGGIYSLASVILDGSLVSHNTVNVPASQGDGGGGGILMAQTSDNSDNLTITDSTVSDNTATVAPSSGGGPADANGGGGIYQDGGNLTVVGSLIENNTAAVSTATPITPNPTDGGGGIFMFGNLFRLQDSTVTGNVAHGPGVDRGGGGGILDSGNGSQYLSSTITANSTDEPAAGDNSDGGGGVLLNNVKDGVTVANMTINGNSASAATGGGINNEISTTATVTNSILAGNTASDTNGNCAGPMISVGFNLTDDPAGSDTCSLTATGDIVGVSPGMGGLADNGGPTPTEALLPGSPAIDAGDPAGCTDLLGDPLGTDQRGVVRPQPAGGRCDIGAYEVALPVVSTDAASVTGSTVVLAGTAAEPDPRLATVRFQYGPTVTYGSQTTAQVLSGFSGQQAVAASVGGLQPGTYHFRVVATNPDGASTGTDGVFTIAAAKLPPAVTTQAPARVGAFAVSLKGAVNPEGQTTQFRFELGTKASGRFGASTPTGSLAGGSRSVGVSASLTGLRPGQVYRYRLVATNAAGTTTGTSVQFRMPGKRRSPGFSAKVNPSRATTAPFTYVITGRLSLPSGLPAAFGCTGTVNVRAIALRATIAQGSTTIAPSCRYRLVFTLTDDLPGTLANVRIYVAFAGNPWLARRRAAPLVVALHVD